MIVGAASGQNRCPKSDVRPECAQRPVSEREHDGFHRRKEYPQDIENTSQKVRHSLVLAIWTHAETEIFASY